MSGGVDSSVAAALLHESGYDVVGVFMRTGVDAPAGEAACETGRSLPVYSSGRARGCCSAVDATDARAVAARLGAPFYALNFSEEFERLMDDFADEYVRGRTPNPCVRCNQWLKFGRLAAYARVVDAEFIATGHYAVLVHDVTGVARRARLFRARDRRKDQSYVLFGVAPDVLARTLLPIGGLTKDEVRDQARRLGLIVHDKPESQDICFVPDGDYARVVKRRRPGRLLPGDIRHVDGRVVGRHAGVAAFTIGQRKGVRVAMGTPVYVTSLDPGSRTVTVGPRDALRATGLIATEVNWLAPPEPGAGHPGSSENQSSTISAAPDRADARPASQADRIDRTAPRPPFHACVQIRYHHTPVSGMVTPEGISTARVRFDDYAEAVTPGQAAVFYRGDEVLGGGWIERPL